LQSEHSYSDFWNFACFLIGWMRVSSTTAAITSVAFMGVNGGQNSQLPKLCRGASSCLESVFLWKEERVAASMPHITALYLLPFNQWWNLCLLSEQSVCSVNKLVSHVVRVRCFKHTVIRPTWPRGLVCQFPHKIKINVWMELLIATSVTVRTQASLLLHCVVLQKTAWRKVTSKGSRNIANSKHRWLSKDSHKEDGYRNCLNHLSV
jgi:hypothetical protein